MIILFGLYIFGNKEKFVVVSGDIEIIKDLKNMRILMVFVLSVGSSVVF